MSFFDEADEPPRTQTRSPSRSAGSRSRPTRPGGGGGRGGSGSGSGSGGRSGSGSRRRPPAGPNHQSIVARRAVAAVALVVVIVLIAVGVNSCQSSARKSAVQDYANSVNTLITQSDATSTSLFKALSGASASGVTTASQSINQAEQAAGTVLHKAQGLSVPSAVKSANASLIRALQQRLDGITNIANEIQPALGTSITRDAVKQIAGEMARFYSSDVLYKDYAAPEIVSALHANHVAVGGADGAQINGAQFLPSLNWLRPNFVAAQLNVTLPTSSGGKGGKPSPGLHGHSLTSVSVGGATLQPGATNTVAASPTPTFTINFSNGGDSNETDVTCRVTVTGQGVGGTKVVPETFAGKSATCAVTLSTSPPQGTFNVVATIEKVPGETNTTNNTETFPVTFN